MKTILRHRVTKGVLFVLCLVPFALLVYRWNANLLGINRGEAAARFTGDWTLRFLLLSLAITPLRRLRGLADLIRFRRMLGLFAFFYGTVHLAHYLNFDKAWYWPEIWEDFRIRRFYSMGLLSYAAMVPLALTSTNAAVRKLGGKRWQLLHRLAYVSAAAGVIHFYWQGKAALLDPLVYAAILGLLLLWRVGLYGWKRLKR